MKYFLYVDSRQLFAVKKEYWKYIDIINSSSQDFDDNAVNEAISFLVKNCKPILFVDAISQTL